MVVDRGGYSLENHQGLQEGNCVVFLGDFCLFGGNIPLVSWVSLKSKKLNRYRPVTGVVVGTV